MKTRVANFRGPLRNFDDDLEDPRSDRIYSLGTRGVKKGPGPQGMRGPRGMRDEEFLVPSLLGTLCSPTPFAPQNPLLLNTFCCQEHFTSQHILLPGTLCSSAPFPPWNTLLLNTFSSLELFAPKHIMLLGIHLNMT